MDVLHPRCAGLDVHKDSVVAAVRLAEPGAGGAEGNRTPDLVIANDALSQLSYSPDPRPRLLRPRRPGVKAAGRACRAPPPSLGCRRYRSGRSMFLLDAVFFLIRAVLDLLWWAVLLAAIVQTLIAFNVLDTRNRVVWTVADFLYRVTEPLFRRVRGFLPNFGGVDLSPLIVLLLITAANLVVGAVQRYMILSGVYF